MEMHQIRYFLTLCEELNFTRAAERCNVAQPSITRAIKMLEVEFGGALFHRERANTHLSELGRMVKPYLEQMYIEAEGAKRQAAAFLNMQRTSLRLGLMCTIAPDYLLKFIEAVIERHPGIMLQIADDSASKLQEALLSGESEVAIYAMPTEPPDNRLHYLPLYREEFVIVMPKGHRLCTQSIVSIEELDGECYLSRTNCEYGASIDHIFEANDVDWPDVFESERDDWILAMAAAGLGLAFMPKLSVRHEGVVAKPMHPEFSREVALVTVRGRQRSPAVGALVAEAMRATWNGQAALAVQAMREKIENDGKLKDSNEA